MTSPLSEEAEERVGPQLAEVAEEQEVRPRRLSGVRLHLAPGSLAPTEDHHYNIRQTLNNNSTVMWCSLETV